MTYKVQAMAYRAIYVETKCGELADTFTEHLCKAIISIGGKGERYQNKWVTESVAKVARVLSYKIVAPNNKRYITQDQAEEWFFMIRLSSPIALKDICNYEIEINDIALEPITYAQAKKIYREYIGLIDDLFANYVDKQEQPTYAELDNAIKSFLKAVWKILEENVILIKEKQ